MGGGENQVAPLSGKIKTAMQKKKKMVVLLDEVGLMGNPILESLFNIVKKCYDKDLLLLGILTKVSNDKYLF